MNRVSYISLINLVIFALFDAMYTVNLAFFPHYTDLPRFRNDLSDLLRDGTFVGDSGHELGSELDADGRSVLAHSNARKGGDLDAISHPAHEVPQHDTVSSRVGRDVHVITSLVG